MSAPLPDPSLSISSSGHSDGLGRRSVVFDREDGVMLEALHVRPEFSAFENALRARIEQMASFDDERFARIRGIDRDPETRELVVISEFVPGSRLSDLLDVAEERAQEGVTPGVDVALGYLLEALPAISALHGAARVTHGTIAPGRTVLTPEGQVVFLDTAYGEVLERLHYSRKRLWLEFGLALPPSAGISRLDAAADIGQAALNAVMLVLGRPLRENEFPESLRSLVTEVVEVAQIRGTGTFAGGVQRFLERALPFHGRRPYANADEAAIDVRNIARHDLGPTVCREALIEFITDTAEGLAAPQASIQEAGAAEVPAEEAFEPEAREIDVFEPADEPAEELETEVHVEQELVAEAAAEHDAAAAETIEAPESKSETEESRFEDFTDALGETLPAPASGVEPEPETAWEEPESAREPIAAEPIAAEPVVTEPPVSEPVVSGPVSEVPAESPRRKRHRSARARKDRLRSISTEEPPAGSTARPAPPPLVSPERAAAFNSEDFNPPRTIGFGPPAAPPQPPAPPAHSTFAPAALAPAAAPIPMPQFPTAPPNPYGGPSTTIWSAPAAPPELPAPPAKPVEPPPPRPIPLAQPAPAAPVAGQPIGAPAPIRLKSDSTAFSGPSRPRAELPEEPHRGFPQEDEPPAHADARAFPWKLAAAAVVLVLAGVAGGRYYLSGPTEPAPGSTAGSAAAPAAAANPKAPGPASADAGHIDLQTQPPGAHVLLDGQPAGETPLKLDVAPGRHVLTFVSASGSIKRNVRVDAGKSIRLDVPLFSGWVAIFAPIVLEVSENGRSIGSTEDGRLMLAPGPHELTLTNRDLGYVGKKSVDIEPGGVNTVNVDPRGSVNFNAIPWAEVWIDGQKAGDTPLADAQVPLGVREIVFKNPDYGERKVVTTVRADTAGAVSVDFTAK